MKRTVASLRPIIAFGMVLVISVAGATAYSVQRFLPQYILRSDALEIAERIVALQGAETTSTLLVTPDHAVVAAALLEHDLSVIAGSGGASPEWTAKLVASEQDRKAALGALASQSPHFLHEAPTGGAGTLITRIFLPTPRDGAAPKLLVADIDQSSLAGLLARTLRIGMMLLLGISAIGAILPVFIGFRRAAQRRQTDDHIRFLALHDPLTGLPNRVQMKEHLGQALLRAKRRNSQVGVLALDLDRFKEVNDTLGHAAGDDLLIGVAERLRASLRDSDMVARLGGDEFAIVIEDPSALNDIASLSRRICAELAKPYKVNGHDFCTSASIGIAIGPLDGSTPDTLQRNADLALYRAKADGRNAYTFFEPSMDTALKERSLLEHDLRRALDDKQLRLAYQPQFDPRSGVLTGYEALLRWDHPTRGAISPDTFIPLAEESGVIHRIAEWVLDTASRDAATWPHGAMLAVNLSPAQFKTGNIAASVAHILHRNGLDPHRLDLEIPETILFDSKEATLAGLRKLRQMGVTITIDDFGTGFSSLSHLSRFPFDKIKIDRTFVASIRRDGAASPIVDAIVGIGESLGVVIAAEGIETHLQADVLRAAGCTQVQGYLFGAPAGAAVSRAMAISKAADVRQATNAA